MNFNWKILRQIFHLTKIFQPNLFLATSHQNGNDVIKGAQRQSMISPVGRSPSCQPIVPVNGNRQPDVNGKAGGKDKVRFFWQTTISFSKSYSNIFRVHFHVHFVVEPSVYAVIFYATKEFIEGINLSDAGTFKTSSLTLMCLLCQYKVEIFNYFHRIFFIRSIEQLGIWRKNWDFIILFEIFKK